MGYLCHVGDLRRATSLRRELTTELNFSGLHGLRPWHLFTELPIKQVLKNPLSPDAPHLSFSLSLSHIHFQKIKEFPKRQEKTTSGY